MNNMKRQCRVCDEPAAGFHFGAFTCEGCKSFFGRTYNNVNSLGDCKSGGRCIINKKNRTTCKACRLRKCLLVGMSKSGSRYGRRSNWFKVTCLIEDQKPSTEDITTDKYWNTSDNIDDNDTIDVCSITEDTSISPCQRRLSPALSSPDSHSSDNSLETDTSSSRSSNSIYSRFEPSSYNSLSFNGSSSLPQLFVPPSSMTLSQPGFPNPYMYPYLYHTFPKLPISIPGLSKDIKKEESSYGVNTETEYKDKVTGRLEGIKRPADKDIDDMYIAKRRCLPTITVKSENELVQPSLQTNSNIQSNSHVSKPVTLNSEILKSSDNSNEDSPIDLSIKRKSLPQEYIEISSASVKDPCILDLSVKSRNITEEKYCSKRHLNSSLPTHESKDDTKSAESLLKSRSTPESQISSHSLSVVPLNLSAKVH